VSASQYTRVPPLPPQPPPRSGIRWLHVAFAFVLGAGVGFVAYGAALRMTEAEQSPPVAQDSAPPSFPSATETSSPEPPPAGEPAGGVTRQDVELSLKTTDRQCFGSAGCNVIVEVRLDVNQAAVAGLPDGGTWDVTYEISGDESGPLIGTFSMYGNGRYDVNEEFLSTPSRNTTVRVKVLSVERFF
jgi:hypothetical protein